jgi:hypothetical protein
MPLEYRYQLSMAEKKEMFRMLDLNYDESIHGATMENIKQACELLGWVNDKVQDAFDEGMNIKAVNIKKEEEK